VTRAFKEGAVDFSITAALARTEVKVDRFELISQCENQRLDWSNFVVQICNPVSRSDEL